MRQGAFAVRDPLALSPLDNASEEAPLGAMADVEGVSCQR